MDTELARCLDAFQQNWKKNRKEKGMSKKNYSVLESLDLAEKLLAEIKKHKTENQPKVKSYRPPKWLLGRETLYSPKEKEDK